MKWQEGGFRVLAAMEVAEPGRGEGEAPMTAICLLLHVPLPKPVVFSRTNPNVRCVSRPLICYGYVAH